MKRCQVFSLEKRKTYGSSGDYTTCCGTLSAKEQKDPLKHSFLSLYRLHRHWQGWTFSLTSMTKRKVDIFETTAYHKLTCTLSFSPWGPMKDSFSLPISPTYPLHICCTSKHHYSSSAPLVRLAEKFLLMVTVT